MKKIVRTVSEAISGFSRALAFGILMFGTGTVFAANERDVLRSDLQTFERSASVVKNASTDDFTESRWTEIRRDYAKFREEYEKKAESVAADDRIPPDEKIETLGIIERSVRHMETVSAGCEKALRTFEERRLFTVAEAAAEAIRSKTKETVPKEVPTSAMTAGETPPKYAEAETPTPPIRSPSSFGKTIGTAALWIVAGAIVFSFGKAVLRGGFPRDRVPTEPERAVQSHPRLGSTISAATPRSRTSAPRTENQSSQAAPSSGRTVRPRIGKIPSDGEVPLALY